MSEVTLGSDNLSWFPLELVRSHTGFGQVIAVPSETCPKSHWVRTTYRGFLWNLSEVTTGSDKLSPFPLKLVRSHTGFGQVIAVPSGTCPKSHWVRTTYRGFLQNLSEDAPGSDNLSWFPLKLVRSRTEFGQFILVFSETCPKSHRVRTVHRGFLWNLSEVALGSDNSSWFPLNFVRSRPGFGQVIAVS